MNSEASRHGNTAALEWSAGLARVLLALWAGSLWTTGYIVAPTLFATLDRVQAGEVAGRLFTLVAWLGWGAGGLFWTLDRWLLRASRPWMAWMILAMLSLTLVGEFGIRPRMEELKAARGAAQVAQSDYAAAFGRLHALSAGLYLAQSVMAVVLVAAWRR